MATDGTIFSFIVDTDPIFSYAGWHLARSLIQHCGSEPSAVVVQCTPEVTEDRRAIFRGLGCSVLEIARFGDGRHCNKINEIDNLHHFGHERAVLLDTDTIALSDLRPFLHDRAILGKIVDLPNPPLATLQEIAATAGLQHLPATVPTDTGRGDTYFGNCNGGFYSIPRACAEPLSKAWKYWALWLLDHIEPLRCIGRENHVDQISFWLALHMEKLPFELAPSNVNHFIHLTGAHRHFDSARPIALLHYHGVSLNDRGQLAPRVELDAPERAAVAAANDQIGKGYDERLCWELRQRSRSSKNG